MAVGSRMATAQTVKVARLLTYFEDTGAATTVGLYAEHGTKSVIQDDTKIFGMELPFTEKLGSLAGECQFGRGLLGTQMQLSK